MRHDYKSYDDRSSFSNSLNNRYHEMDSITEQELDSAIDEYCKFRHLSNDTKAQLKNSFSKRLIENEFGCYN